jgi:perosamine synthetase
MEALAARGIPTRPYFKPIHLQPFYRKEFGYREGYLPITESVSQRTLALPFYGNLEEKVVEHICTCLEESILQHRRSG